MKEYCRYIYVAGDKAVLDGRAQIGDRCKCPSLVSEKSHWLCGGHLKQWNVLNNPEAVKEQAAKQAESLKASRERNRKKNADIVANSQEILGEQTAEIIKVMNTKEPFDLTREYLIFKNLKQDPTQEAYAEKYAYALWLNTPDTKRTPKTDEEVSAILGVSVFTLGTWRRSPELVRIINNDTKQIALRCYPYVWEKVMEGVTRGDKGYADLALKHIKDLQDKADSGPKLPPITAETLADARKICSDGTANRATGVVDKATKTIVYDGLVKGEIEQ